MEIEYLNLLKEREKLFQTIDTANLRIAQINHELQSIKKGRGQ